jgi:Fe-S cluster assembly protein SufD
MATSALKTPVRLGPAEQSLLEQLRSVGANEAADRLEQIGLPTRRVESYHYTDLKMLLRIVPPLATAPQAGARTGFRIPGATEFIILNGKVFAQEDLPDGVSVRGGSGSALTLRDDVLVRLNTALVRESLTLDLHGQIGSVVHIDRRSEGEPAHSASAAHIYVADNSEAVILETYSASSAGHLANDSSFVVLGRNAKVTHITLDLSPRDATHFSTTEYELAEGAQLRTLAIQAGATLARAQIFARFAGEGAHADFTGLNLVDTGQHLDITLDVSHAVPNTTSQELFKQIARGRSRGVFQGRIVVARDAQKTDAKMMMQGLMLSDEAEILSKPELEIYADDVVCGHGSTCGQLDEDHLFYLMSRGIPKDQAQSMLVQAFMGELLDPIEDPALNAALHGVVDRWLAP